MPGRIEAITVIARHELSAAVRGRMILAFAALFAVLAVAIALAGLGASGQLLVQGFARTTVSLLSLSLYLLPLIGAITGATAFGGEAGSMALLLAQPIGRAEALLGRVAGLAAALTGVAFIGFGAAGVLVVMGAGSRGVGAYLLVAGGATLVGLIGLGIGTLLGIRARCRATAVGWALALWFAAAVLYDLASIAILQLTGSGEVGPWLIALLAANPIDGVRTLGLVALGADILLGPTGVALREILDPGGGALWILTSLGFWLFGPLAVAVVAYRKCDF